MKGTTNGQKRGRARFLVIDGYHQAGRAELVAGGASAAGDLYIRMLQKCLPAAECDVVHPADPGASLPKGAALEQYDGIAWTGCSLTIYEDDPRVGAQIAVAAAGGIVRANPRGREMGVARKIALTPEGRGHPLYFGKSSVFDAFISHVDEITHLPAGAVLLASNAFTHIQAVAVTHKGGQFWGLQYHPEYNLHELARLTFCRIAKLVSLGFFRDGEAATNYVDMLEVLHQDPSRKDIAWMLGIDDDVMNEDVRLTEVRNWIDRLVLPSIRH